MGSFALGGEYSQIVMARIAVGLIPVFLGFWPGIRLQKRLPQEGFYRAVRISLFFIAVSLVVRSIWNLT